MAWVVLGFMVMTMAQAGAPVSVRGRTDSEEAPRKKRTVNPAETLHKSAASTDETEKKTEVTERLTLKMEDTTLGEVVLRVGLESTHCLALMRGLENRKVDRVSFRGSKAQEVASTLVKIGSSEGSAGAPGSQGLVLHQAPGYFFIFPQGYEALLSTPVAGTLSSPFTKKIDRVAFGGGMALYAVFTTLGQALDTTIVADNAVAASECGQVVLRDIGLDETIEAILRSARIAKFHVDCTDEYVFLQAPGNPSPRSALLEEESLSSEQREFLDHLVSVTLPEPSPNPARPHAVMDAQRLSEVLPSLSVQLGIRVVAERGLGRLPVNPVTFSNVRVQTAMDLLCRQWLVPQYGYQLTRDRIVIRRRIPLASLQKAEAAEEEPVAEKESLAEPAPAAKEPGVEEEPAEPEEPGAPEEPAVAEEPTPAEEPVAEVEPASVPEEPAVAEEPAAPEEPAVFEGPAPAGDPAAEVEPATAAGQPVAPAEPATAAGQPVAPAEPATAAGQPVAPAEPAAAAGQPVAPAESAAAEEPGGAEEPAAAEESAAAEQGTTS